MTARVTLKDVADKSGVSTAAASRALNDRSGVQPEVRERVKLVAKALGYQPNRSAQSLVSGRASMLGLLAGGAGLATDVYAAGLVQEVVTAAAAADQGLALIAGSGDPEETVGRIVSHRQIDGVIVSVVAAGSRLTEALLDTGLPIVLIGTDSAHAAANVVHVENLESSARIVGHLLDGGAERVATITGRLDRNDGRERLDGFRLAHRRRNHPVDEALILQGDFSAMRAYDLTDQLLAQQPDAVFCANDPSALGVYRRAIEAGLAVPDQLSIAGFDGTSRHAFSLPRLTSMVQPFAKIAETAVARLLALIDGEDDGPQRISITPELFLGTTTKPA